jgi:hypothetical protein
MTRPAGMERTTRRATARPDPQSTAPVDRTAARTFSPAAH